GVCSTASSTAGPLRSLPLQLTYDGSFREIREQEAFRDSSSPSALRSG
uniref:Uncharacterized protein n=1 Tax=Jaculus jaculus TaxID=51337 RepID=A0A8C5K4Y7_JACJA